jgi:hypothetical protein
MALRALGLENLGTLGSIAIGHLDVWRRLITGPTCTNPAVRDEVRQRS